MPDLCLSQLFPSTACLLLDLTDPGLVIQRQIGHTSCSCRSNTKISFFVCVGILSIILATFCLFSGDSTNTGKESVCLRFCRLSLSWSLAYNRRFGCGLFCIFIFVGAVTIHYVFLDWFAYIDQHVSNISPYTHFWSN